MEFKNAKGEPGTVTVLRAGVGRDLSLSRRVFLIGGIGVAGALRGMPSSPACVLTTEQEEGPFYVDYKKVRRDITEGKQGVPLQLKIALVHAKKCTPLTNAALDIWQCDASGVYSAFTKVKMGPPPGMGGPDGPPGGPGGRPLGPPPGGGFGPPPGMGNHKGMDETRFLRGVQAADSNGMVEFATIYPGWYEGRTIHIHLKVHTGGHVSHTGQLFFPEDVTERIAKMQPYAANTEVHRTTQAEDHVYQDEHGAPGMVTLARIDPRSEAGGFIATVTLAVDPEATPAPVGMGGPGGPGSPPAGGY
jgi:protocatechuate 3,4-dioxygenase beta subunit